MPSVSETAPKAPVKSILVVAGLAGAGKTTALKTLEDLGFETIDNMPLRLVPALVSDAAALPQRLALGVDVRNHDIATHLGEAVAALRAAEGVETHILFLQAEDDVLLRRFKETRRKHPLHDGRPVLEIVALERQVLDPVRDTADTLLDTSHFKPADMRRYLEAQFGASKNVHMAVFLMSFGFKHGLPKEADLVFDMRFLRNPHYDAELRPHTGLEQAVKDYIAEDANLAPTLQRLEGLLRQQLPLFKAEGKSYLTIAIGCTGGRHRSVMVTEELNHRLADLGLDLRVHHRDIENEAR